MEIDRNLLNPGTSVSANNIGFNSVSFLEQCHPELRELINSLSNPDQTINLLKQRYPQVNLLEDAQSYGGNGNEVKRTLKSQLNLLRYVALDINSLGGEQAEKMRPGLELLGRLTLRGLLMLGNPEGTLSLEQALTNGLERMLLILAIHDIAKSELVGNVAKESLGCSDHDQALSALVQTNFSCLEGKLSTEAMTRLRTTIADPVIHKFLSKERSIVGFNPGRHMQGEAAYNLFAASVKSADPISIAEFIADWSGTDGHTNLTGPNALAHIPPAINGTADALELLNKANDTCTDMESLFYEFSYPVEKTCKLGLSLENEYERAITRIAFMGREHQKNDDIGRAAVSDLRRSFSSLPNDIQEQLVVELNRPDLDLGFTPHTIEAIRKIYSGQADTTASATNQQTYSTFLLMLHRVIESVRLERVNQPTLTINLNVKVAGRSMADNLDYNTKNAMAAIARTTIHLQCDANNNFSVDFGRNDSNSTAFKQLQVTISCPITATTCLIGGVGGGGDVFQAAGPVAKLLSKKGVNTAAFFSVRQGDLQTEQCRLQNFEIVDAEHMIIKLCPETQGLVGSSSRLPELGVLRAEPEALVYLIFDHDQGRSLSAKIAKLANILNSSRADKIDAIVGVDTGGDSLETDAGQTGENHSKSTPDQDRTSVIALSEVPNFNTYMCVLGLGIDSPSDSVEKLVQADARVMYPDTAMVMDLLRYYAASQVGCDSQVFSRTALIYSKALILAGSDPQYVFIEGIPLDKRSSLKNPWQSWILMQEHMQALCFLEASKHRALIQKNG